MALDSLTVYHATHAGWPMSCHATHVQIVRRQGYANANHQSHKSKMIYKRKGPPHRKGVRRPKKARRHTSHCVHEITCLACSNQMTVLLKCASHRTGARRSFSMRESRRSIARVRKNVHAGQAHVKSAHRVRPCLVGTGRRYCACSWRRDDAATW